MEPANKMIETLIYSIQNILPFPTIYSIPFFTSSIYPKIHSTVIFKNRPRLKEQNSFAINKDKQKNANILAAT